MPTYQYKCRLCDEPFEVEQRISDDSLTSLPGCAQADDGNHPLKKVFSAVGISFKGDGFYRNDSRSGAKRSNGSGSSSNSDSSGSTSSSSSSSADSGSSSDKASSGSTSSSSTPVSSGSSSGNTSSSAD
ncbi:MAG: FmdB family zinc ribbon protein [Acidimicrobiales bacterium]